LTRAARAGNTAPIGFDEQQDGTVPAPGVLIGRGGGRLVPVVVATTLALAAGVRGLVAVVSTTPFPDGARAGWLLVDLGVAVVAAAAAWSVVMTNRRAAVGVTLLLAGWLLPSSAAWSAWPSELAVVVLSAAPVTAAGAAIVVLSWSRLHEERIRLVQWLLAGVAGGTVAVGALGYDPFADPACRLRCGHVLPFLAGLVSTRGVVLATSVITLGVLTLAGGLLWRSRASRASAVAVAAALGLLAVVTSAPLLHWRDAERPLDDPGLTTLAVLLTAGAVLAAGITSSRIRRAIEGLASDLQNAEATLAAQGGIRSVAYAVPGESRWVDARGHGVTEPLAPSEVVDLYDGSGPAVRLELARSGSPLVGGLPSATRLALANARLAAVGRARLVEVQASQRRIVDTRDAERRRIERDLHDGVQQRLVSVAFHLQLAMRHAGPGAVEQLARAEAEVHDGLRRLRALAHGVFPAVLTDEGLRPAVEDLVSAADGPVRLDLQTPDDVPENTAMAVYATVSAVLSALRPTTAGVHLQAAEEGGALTVQVDLVGGALDAASAALVGAADRVGALGGEFTIQGDGTRLMAVIPCGW
jgi:signal transduction histidine kinase